MAEIIHLLSLPLKHKMSDVQDLAAELQKYLLLDGSRAMTGDLLPNIDGRFLGETTTPLRWDGSKLINVPNYCVLGCWVADQTAMATVYYSFNNPTGSFVWSAPISPMPNGTFIKVNIYVTSNTNTSDSRFYIGRSPLSKLLVITVPAGATGLFTADINYPTVQGYSYYFSCDTSLTGGTFDLIFNPVFIFKFT